MANLPQQPKDDPSTTSSAHDIMAPRIEKMNAVMGGSDALRVEGELYLPRFKAETTENWEDRLKRNVFVNYFRRSVESLVGKPFANPIVTRDEDKVPDEIQELFSNIDHQGNNLNVFARNVFQDGLVKGLTHIMVEYPNTGEMGVQTAAEEQELNITPYWIHIPPENILAAYCEIRNGEEFLTQVRISEQETIPFTDGFGEEHISRVRVLTPGKWVLWRYYPDGDGRKKGKWQIEKQGETSLDFIPLYTFYTYREDFMVGYPLLTDLANVNIAHWQSMGDQISILTVARFPILAVSGTTEEEASQIKISPRKVMYTADPNGKFYYVSHNGESIAAGRQQLLDFEEKMSIMGIELLKRSGSATATAKAIDTAENLSMLQAIVLIYCDFLKKCLDATAKWMALNDGDGGQIRINTDFGIKMEDPTDLQTLTLARTNREISHETFVSELQRRGTLSEDFDAEADQELIDAEIAKAAADAAAAQPDPTVLLPPTGEEQDPPKTAIGPDGKPANPQTSLDRNKDPKPPIQKVPQKNLKRIKQN